MMPLTVWGWLACSGHMRLGFPPFAKCAKDRAPTAFVLAAKSKGWATRQEMRGWRPSAHDVTYEPHQMREMIGQVSFQRKKEFLNAAFR